MENTGYVALSYATGLERKMDIISNNIANIDTNGFKSDHMMFHEYVVNSQKQPPLSMVEDYGNYRNLNPGPIQHTGNPLDVALNGNGFLAVSTPNGEKYTRNGAMSVNSQGQLINSNGDLMADTGGSAITIPQDAGNISISDNGTITTNLGQAGRLKIARFSQPQQMTPIGNNLFETKESAVEDDTTTVHQGALEGSNVNAVMEMTNMIDVMRKYESVAQILQNEHTSQMSMIDRLAKIS
jgi:flagellar basal-body rod protein FlgF